MPPYRGHILCYIIEGKTSTKFVKCYAVSGVTKVAAQVPSHCNVVYCMLSGHLKCKTAIKTITQR